MNKGGRPKIKIDWEQFDKLCAIQCTLREISNWFDCSEDTIERLCKREKGIGFAEYYDKKGSKGKVALRRKMYELAMGGDRTLCIWLSKQYLGMADKQEVAQVVTEGPSVEDFEKTIDIYLESKGQKRVTKGNIQG